MRYRYLMDVAFGLILILAPFVGRFVADRPALYTDVGVGVLLLAWALVEYLTPRGLKACGLGTTHA